MKKTWKAALAVLLSVGVLAGVASLAYHRGRSSAPAETVTLYRDRTVEVPVEVEKEVIVPVEKKVVITSEIIEEGFADAGELVSETYAYTEVSSNDSRRIIEIFGQDVVLPGTRSYYIYSYQGVIKAGVDFSKIQVRKDDAHKIITVTMPAPYIISHELLDDSFRLYDEKQNLFNPMSVSDFARSNAALKAAAADRAIAGGLLERADDSARLLIRGFLRSGYDLGDYHIRIKEG